MLDLDTLKKQYNEATLAYHQLMTGGAVRVYVDQNSERVEYTAANKSNLWAYLLQLRGLICQLDPSDPVCAIGMGRTSGPARFTF